MRYARQLGDLKQRLNVIFIGDSYGAGQGLSDTSQNWIDYAASWLGRASGYRSFSYKKSAASGAGFIGQSTNTTFLKQLQSITTEGAESNLDVTDIVVCGGWNDGSQAINSAVYDFQQYCIKHYPYAKIHLGYISWEDGRITGGTKYARAVGLAKYIHAAQENRMEYIANIQYVMHDYSLFQSDGIHPTGTGNSKIAAAVVNHLLGGGVNAIDGWAPFNPTYAGGVVPDNANGTYSTYRHDNMSGFFCSATAWTFSSAVNFSGHPADDSNGVGWKKLFELPKEVFVEGGSFGGLKKSMPFAYYNGSTYVIKDTWVQVRNADGKAGLYICPMSVSGSGYDPVTGITHVIAYVGSINLDAPSMYT